MGDAVLRRRAGAAARRARTHSTVRGGRAARGGSLARGPLLLLLPLLALPAGPLPADGQEVPDHRGLACAACHRGAAADRAVGAVPSAACTGSGCHERGGPERVRLETVAFRHRSHGDNASPAPTCAGCHVHERGREPLVAETDACLLCHADALAASEPSACLTCHRRPEQVPTTSGGVPVPHADIPWLETGCVRCHYDVGRPDLEVGTARCGDCHERLTEVTAHAAGRDPHPPHRGVACLACHEEGGHAIQAMSSSVRLACGSCHAGSHDLRAGESPGDAVCRDCHREAHAPVQRMVLGLVPGETMSPAPHFMAGLTCGSCHLPESGSEDGAPGAGIEGRRVAPAGADACVDCHRGEYARVPAWWERGARQRLERARAYLARAERAVGTLPLPADSLAAARGLLELARAGGVWHNPFLLDRLTLRAVGGVEGAYRAAGREPPPRPETGLPARPGLCSSCHFEVGAPSGIENMPSDFHREVLGG